MRSSSSSSSSFFCWGGGMQYCLMNGSPPPPYEWKFLDIYTHGTRGPGQFSSTNGYGNDGRAAG